MLDDDFWKHLYLFCQVWKHLYLFCQVWKPLYLFCQVWKYLYLFCQAWKYLYLFSQSFDDLVPQEWVTREHCARQLICRGLNRACCVHLLDPILAFLTSAGYINVGLVSPPPHLRLSTNSQVGWGVFYHDLTATLPYHYLTLHRLSTNSQVGWGGGGLPWPHSHLTLHGCSQTPL